MGKKVTLGKIIAAVLSLLLTGIVWGVVFPPGGSGANIFIGIFAAIFFVYWCIGTVGGYIDQEFFPGGSKKRARLYRSLEKLIKESKTHISNIKKSKRRRRKIGNKALDNLEQAMIQGVLVLNNIRDGWVCESSIQKEHECMLKEAHDRIEAASSSVFSLDRNWRFLYGLPSLIMALFFALLIREFIVEPYQIPSGSMIKELLVGDHLFVSKFYYGLSKPFVKDPDFLIQWRKPKPGDVVIFKAPSYVGRHAGQAWIKRVIAVAGQKIRIINNVVYVDDEAYEHIEPERVVEYMEYYGFRGGGSAVWRKQKAIRTVEKIGDVTHGIQMSMQTRAPGLGPYWPTGDEGRLPGLVCTPEYCRIKKGHLFVMGDNRGNSLDSRAWGALPESRIKGKAWFIWMSVDGSGQSVKLGPFTLPNFRFERWFKSIG